MRFYCYVDRLVISMLILLNICAISYASVPPMISYQGKLMQPSGAAVPDGTYSMQFAIYDVPTGGTALWSETNPSVAVKGGLFSVLLGSVVNLPSNIFDNQSRFFGVKVGSDPEMTPRQQIASSAFAFRSAVAGTVDDGAITTSKLADGAVTEAKIADASVTAMKIASGSVDTDKIPDLAITASKISDGSITQTKAPSLLRATDIDGEFHNGLFMQTKRITVATTSNADGWSSPEQTWTFAVPFSTECVPIVLATTTSEFYGYYVHPLIVGVTNTSVRFLTQRMSAQADYRTDASNQITLVAIGY